MSRSACPTTSAARVCSPGYDVSLAAPRVRGPVAVIAGSSSAATLEQVRRFGDAYPALKLDPLDGDLDGPASRAVAELGRGAVLVYSTAPADEVARVQEQLGVERAGELIEGALGDAARRLVEAGARTVVVAGGETSGAVLSALGVRALAVGPEIATGVPWMTSLGGPPLTLVLKSGNFGGPDFLLDAVARAAPPRA